MKLRPVLTFFSLFCFAFISHAQTPNLEWAFGFGGTSGDYPFAIDLDPSSNVYVAGYFRNTVDFDPSAGTADLTSNGNTDAYLAKYDSLGNYLWAIGIGGSDVDRGYDVKVDQNLDVYVMGTFRSAVDFDPSAGTANLTGNGSNDVFLAKYNSSGNYLWAIAMGGTDNDQSTSLGLDSSGNVYITGLFESTVDFDPGAGTNNMTSNGEQDVFLAKYDSNGALVWSKAMGGTEDDGGYGMAIGSDNSIFLTGYFENTVDFNPGAGTANLTSTGVKDIFFGKYDSDGNYIWAHSLEDTDGSLGSDIAVDANDNILVNGSYFGTIDMDPSAGTADLTTNGSHDGFVGKYDPNGNYIWSLTVGGTQLDHLNHASVDALGNLYTTGYYKGTMDLDPGAGTFEITGQGNNDAYIAKYNSSGNFVWGASMGGSDFESGYGIITDAYNNVFATGTFGATADFDPSNGTLDLTSNGGYDGFLMRLKEATCTPTSGTDVQTACDTFTWIDGNTYTSSNNSAAHVLSNAVGCDSIVTLDLSISNSTTGTDTQVACDTYTWIDGNTYMASNSTATHILPNAVGCDSIVTLNLTINNSTTGTDTQVACDTFTWIDGVTYLASNNTATHTLSTTVGCDSVVTLNLTINNSTTGIDTQVACNSYTWIDGNTYNTSNNTATHMLTTASGCDSLVTLNLTINNSTTGTDTQVACNSYTWIDGNTYDASNSTAMFTLSTTAGCDSVVTLNLTISNSLTGTDTQVACDTYTWIDGNTYDTSNNTATQTLTTTAGCDSIVTLNLTINNSTTGTDAQVACDEFTWIDGNTYDTSNSTATHTLTNTAGCDSIVTLDLTINNSTTGTDTQIACDSYTWIDGNTYNASNNTATQTLTNAAGCDSIVTLDLTINSVSDLTITTTDATVTANNASASFQWLDCNSDYAIIAGETGQSFTATVDGNYAVELTENACVDTSACVTITITGIIENSFREALSLYPNPTDGSFYIDLNIPRETIRLRIMNGTGQLVEDKIFKQVQVLEYELDQAKGIYLIEVFDMKDKRSVLRLIKQ